MIKRMIKEIKTIFEHAVIFDGNLILFGNLSVSEIQAIRKIWFASIFMGPMLLEIESDTMQKVMDDTKRNSDYGNDIYFVEIEDNQIIVSSFTFDIPGIDMSGNIIPNNVSDNK